MRETYRFNHHSTYSYSGIGSIERAPGLLCDYCQQSMRHQARELARREAIAFPSAAMLNIYAVKTGSEIVTSSDLKISVLDRPLDAKFYSGERIKKVADLIAVYVWTRPSASDLKVLGLFPRILRINVDKYVSLLYLPTQIRFLIGGERVTCHWSKLHDALGRTKLHDALGQQQLELSTHT